VKRRNAAREKPNEFVADLSKNGFELALVLTTASAMAVLLAQYINRFRFEQMLFLREEIKLVAEILRTMKLGSGTALILLTLLFMLERRYPHSRATDWLIRTWKGWTSGSRWVKRVSLILSMLFCFSFLSGRTGGAVRRLEDLIRNADSHYAVSPENIERAICSKG
jgi:hypothetical protein